MSDHGDHGATLLDGRRTVAVARPLGFGRGWRVKLYGAEWIAPPLASAARVTGKADRRFLICQSRREALAELRKLI